MRRKMLCLFLAVLMTVGMPVIVASADNAPAPKICIGLPGADANGEYVRVWSLVALGGPPEYYLNTEDGLLTTTGATEDNYNVKVAYPEAGKATVYLKDAHLKCSGGTPVSWRRIVTTPVTGYPITLVVESDSTLETLLDDKTGSSVGYPCIDGQVGSMTITGPGKLTAVAHANHVIACGTSDLVIQNANLELKTQMPLSLGTGHVIFAQGNVTIDNSNLELSAYAGAAIVTSKELGSSPIGDIWNVTIQNGSKVSVVSQSANHAAIGCTGELTIADSEVVMVAAAKCFSSKPVLNAVKAIAGIESTNVTVYDETQFDTYTYFKCGKNVVVPAEPGVPTPTVPPATEPTAPAPTAPSVTEPTTPMGTTPVPTENTNQETVPGADNVGNSAERNNRVLIWVGLGCLVVVVTAVVIVAWKRNRNKVETKETTKTE